MIALLVGVQAVNGVLLPVTLFFVWRLASNRELMGSYANGRIFGVLAGRDRRRHLGAVAAAARQ